MDITITGRHQDLEAAARDYITERIGRVVRLHDRLTDARVVLDHDHGLHSAEVTIHAPRGTRFTARAENADLRAAIDAVESRLETQIRNWKERLVDHRP